MTIIRLPDDGFAVPTELRTGSVAHFAYVSTTMLKFVNVFADGKCHNANEIADKLGITLRSTYRYASRLKTLGFKVRGEAGVGYLVEIPSKYAVVAMHCETGLPAYVETCNNPIKAVQDARNDRALAQLGYYRFWALPIYEDNHAQGNGTDHKRTSRASHKDHGKDRFASVESTGHQQAL